ncbi:MAG: VWA domain-containing protein [Acidobacteria bacterium]|jgi:Ca-activated chloride channel family protein|nr:MAG: VWA domain-containing protein [Acidobacteriota bacterium]
MLFNFRLDRRTHLLSAILLVAQSLSSVLNCQTASTPTQQARLNSPSGAVEHDPALRHLPALHVGVDLVLVPVTVVDDMNRPVMGLDRQHFSVYEDNDPQQITLFTEEDSPISVGLLLDVSRSMTNKFVTERAAVESFFNNANPKDDYFVVTFADHPKLLTNASQSIEEIQEKLAANIPEGQTALLDAVYLAMSKMRSAQHDRRVMLIISDGGDNHSRYGMKEIKSLVAESNVQVYSIGIFDSLVFRSFEEFMGKRWLGEITDVTGGRTVAAGELGKLPGIAASLSREMRNQYVIGYRPSTPPSDSKWRKIRVRVTPPSGNGKVHAYYKKGYMAAGK